MTIEQLLRMNRLYDADKGGQGGGDAGNGEGITSGTDGKQTKDSGDIDDKPAGDDPGTKNGKGDSDDEPKTFTQEELDRILAERLARDRKKREEEAEAKRLEEEGKYKELYEATQKQLVATKKAELLKDAGYTKEQADLFVNLVTGETDEELTASVEKLKEANPPVQRDYVDPSTGNSRKQEPPKKDASEAGKTLFQRLKEKGKVR